jgi:hypothetical protein
VGPKAQRLLIFTLCKLAYSRFALKVPLRKKAGEL